MLITCIDIIFILIIKFSTKHYWLTAICKGWPEFLRFPSFINREKWVSPDVVQSSAVVLPVGITPHRSLSMSKHSHTGFWDYPPAVVTMINVLPPAGCMVWCLVWWKDPKWAQETEIFFLPTELQGQALHPAIDYSHHTSPFINWAITWQRLNPCPLRSTQKNISFWGSTLTEHVSLQKKS